MSPADRRREKWSRSSMRRRLSRGLALLMAGPALVSGAPSDEVVEQRVAELLGRMTLTEKIGQMSQLNSANRLSPELRGRIAEGRVGSILNEVDVEVVNAMQRVAVEESRLGIPLLIGRDVIHGFNTVLPIPLGLAATFDPGVVERGARMSALEASRSGVNWTFAPMIDVTRDPRWGRIAESFGEDTYLTNVMARAMVRGFQGNDLSAPGTLAATAKHFAGYGASEAGRDYATTNIPENELRNVYLPPFLASVEAGVATVMTSFSDLNGIPATGNRFLMRQILREEWGFDGFVVSDWASIEQLKIHGYTADDRGSALAAVTAGVNMEMATSLYADHLPQLVEDGALDVETIDRLAADILRVKLRMGLFDRPYVDPEAFPEIGNAQHLAIAREAALKSLVLLENRNGTLPLSVAGLQSLAVVGPLADDPHEQLGTWIFDGDESLSQTPLDAIRAEFGEDIEILHVPAMTHSRDRSVDGFAEALDAARRSDATVVFLGEESILSGEAHSRADIGLPGSQETLVRTLRAAGKPLIAVIMAGRPLTLGGIIEQVDALLFAWHPGSMGGPAIADVLFGAASPSGKLPVTFPRMVGQVPIYYNQKHGGKPATADTFQYMDDIPVRMRQSSSGFVSGHLDAGFTPQYPFGHGLSYGIFEYSEIGASSPTFAPGETLFISATIRNAGDRAATEVAQLYVRDLVGAVTRPVRELKGFQRIHLEPGEARRVSFELSAADLAFYGPDMRLITEPGYFHAWVGGNSTATLRTTFELLTD